MSGKAWTSPRRKALPRGLGRGLGRQMPVQGQTGPGRAQDDQKRVQAIAEGPGRNQGHGQSAPLAAGNPGKGHGGLGHQRHHHHGQAVHEGNHPVDGLGPGIDGRQTEHEHKSRQAHADAGGQSPGHAPAAQTHEACALDGRGPGNGLGQDQPVLEGGGAHPAMPAHGQIPYDRDHGRTAEAGGAKAEKHPENPANTRGHDRGHGATSGRLAWTSRAASRNVLSSRTRYSMSVRQKSRRSQPVGVRR